MTNHYVYDDPTTVAIAQMIRAGAMEAELTTALFEMTTLYAGGILFGKENILHRLITDGQPINEKLAHAYERGFYFSTAMLGLVAVDFTYDMAVTEARARLNTDEEGAA